MKKILTAFVCLCAALSFAAAQSSIGVEVHNIVELSEQFNLVFVIEGEHVRFQLGCRRELHRRMGASERLLHKHKHSKRQDKPQHTDFLYLYPSGQKDRQLHHQSGIGKGERKGNHIQACEREGGGQWCQTFQSFRAE